MLIWQISELMWILLLEIQINCKNLVWKKKSIEPSMCSHCQNFQFSIPKMWKIKNVFTFGPTTHATLISMKDDGSMWWKEKYYVKMFT
jgi:hypothetical protein